MFAQKTPVADYYYVREQKGLMHMSSKNGQAASLVSHMLISACMVSSDRGMHTVDAF